jgi:CRISPR/Cas system-associated protein Cas10 (large subunit of type III CRISPR-Cas system)
MENLNNTNKTSENAEKESRISDVIKSLPTEDFFLKHKYKKKSLIHFEIREKLALKELSKRELIYVLEILNNMGNVL